MDMRPRPISNGMRFNLKVTDISITSDIREYLNKKLQSLEKLFDFDDPAVIVDVELGRATRHHEKGDVFFAEITIHRGKESFRAVENGSQMMSAIDGMRDAIAGELAADKGKRLSLLRRGGYIAKAVLRGGYEGLGYLGRPARAGWRYVRSLRPWRK